MCFKKDEQYNSSRSHILLQTALIIITGEYIPYVHK
jgi:hypothetical protein